MKFYKGSLYRYKYN